MKCKHKWDHFFIAEVRDDDGKAVESWIGGDISICRHCKNTCFRLPDSDTIVTSIKNVVEKA